MPDFAELYPDKITDLFDESLWADENTYVLKALSSAVLITT